MSNQNERYRILAAGEIIQQGDEADASVDPWKDPIRWVPVNPQSVGRPAPDPAYPSHTIYRRFLK